MFLESTNRFRLGVTRQGEFGIRATYFTDGINDEEELGLFREEHKHCFVWKRREAPFKVTLGN